MLKKSAKNLPMETPKKRNAVTLDVKKAVIEAAAKSNKNKTQLAKQFKISRKSLDIIPSPNVALQCITLKF
uniref:HTH psq-type domain-containing protein n=1 Tax=Ditylenchus dipsaci TaxID=166011 RepID=A0A915D6Q5_9BILA